MFDGATGGAIRTFCCPGALAMGVGDRLLRPMSAKLLDVTAPRITSYNVCYTKLLRTSAAQSGAIFPGPFGAAFLTSQIPQVPCLAEGWIPDFVRVFDVDLPFRFQLRVD